MHDSASLGTDAPRYFLTFFETLHFLNVVPRENQSRLVFFDDEYLSN